METDWARAIAEVSPQVVRIETATGHGTRFLCYGGEVVRTVATAYHVIDGAFGKPLTIRSGVQAITFGREADRDIKVARLGEFDAALLSDHAPDCDCRRMGRADMCDLRPEGGLLAELDVLAPGLAEALGDPLERVLAVAPRGV